MRRSTRDEAGFTLVELMMAMSVFSIVIVGFALLFAGSLKSFSASRAQTAAGQLASAELEKARNVGWDNLGTVSGNPPGTLVAGPETVTVGSVSFSVTRRVELIDDPVPQGFSTGANYKRVVIRVTAAIMSAPLQVETIVAPPVQPSLYSGVIQPRVTSYVDSTALAGVLVSMTGGPSANRSDTTDADGWVTFAALQPHSSPTTYYTLTASLTGWKPAPAPTTDTQINLAPGDVIKPVLKMYKPGTVTLDLVDQGGDPVTTPVALTMTYAPPTGPVQTMTRSFTSPTGIITIADFNGDDIIPGGTYTFSATSIGYTSSTVTKTLAPVGYPTNVDTVVDIVVPIPARVDTALHFTDQATGLPMVVSGTVVSTPAPSPADPGSFATDAAGLATFRLLPQALPQRYLVTVSPTPPGYYPYSASVTVDGSIDPLDLTIALTPLPAPTTVSFLVRGGTPTAPLAGIPVVVGGGPSGTQTFTTDAAGLGTADLVPGSYTVTVNTPGYVAYSAPLTVTTATPTVDVLLGGQGAVTLATKDAGTSAPLGPVTFTLVGGSGTTIASTDATGSGFLYLNPGTYSIATTSVPAGYAPYAGSITVVAGPQTVDVALSTQGLVTFTTKNASGGAAIPNVTLVLDGPSGSVTVTTNAAGTTTTPQSLTPGTYTYTTSVGAFAPNKGSITVVAGASTHDISITQGYSVSFRTRRSDNTSFRVGPVTLRLSGGPGGDQIITTSTAAADGSSGGSISTLIVGGTYTVTVMSYPSGYTTLHTATVTVSSTSNQTVLVS